MMYSEFYDRTKTNVSYEEYRFIEESYYDFDGDKNAFCKAWLKDKKSGRWEKELKLRMELDGIKKSCAEEIKEKEESLEFYRDQYRRMNETIAEQQRELKALRQKLATIRSFTENCV